MKGLFDQVDNSPLIFFRIVFGALMALESWGAIGTGWVREVFIETPFTFTFIGFEWLGFLHGEIMYVYYIIMGVFGVFVMLGFQYRSSTSILFVLWTCSYLLQKTNYNNHYYLVVLLCGFMVAVPAQQSHSLDVKRDPSKKSKNCPRWAVLLFPVQTAIVYFYATLAKFYPDWLHADPAKLWMRMKSGYFLIGQLLQAEWMPYFISYGGILFDALIIPGLIWKKTRKWAFVVSIFFHLFNSIVFQVGIFPYLMLAITAFFFPANEVRKLFFRKKNTSTVEVKWNKDKISARQITWTTVLGIYFLFQAGLPLRHHFYKGDVHWTEEGHRMSWQMMLRSKSAFIDFKVIDHNRKDTIRISPRDYLSPGQSRMVASKPDMAWQFVQFLKTELNKQERIDISIYASSTARLNRRKAGPLISGEIDLSKVKWEPFKHSDWLMPVPEF